MNPSSPPDLRLRRHDATSRVLHALDALLVLALLVSGAALGEWLAPALVARLGGHEAINAAHQWLGLAYVSAILVLGIVLRRRLAGLIRHLHHWQWRELRWPVAFLAHLLAPGTHRAPFHAGHFDPLERLVLAVLCLALAVVAASGLYLYWLPDAPRWVFIVAIRAHMYAASTLLVALSLHVLAGLGILPTHRGIARAMFGDGRVSETMARTLWPAWAEHAARARRCDDRAGTCPDTATKNPHRDDATLS